MNPFVGWGLAVAAVAVGYAGYGWRGVGLALTVVVFWLLLQWSRVMRVLREAAGRPKGQVDSAVMLQSRLQPGMRLLDVLPLTRSLGEVQPAEPGEERFAWRDASGASVVLRLRGGKVLDWQFSREDGAGPADRPPAAG